MSYDSDGAMYGNILKYIFKESFGESALIGYNKP